ncbi:Metal-sulfur cluster biosynthetic enzyme [Pedobacter steynii]|uniref:Metal-sulfur cluster biosynthetic enzyme n=1 Tax=Pedobacter steynii TaxID=430522 RepID=A0A1G9U6Q4_9SPHI|nr:metal-sulfur cluster assembly factor [Pedobacter steynii]NQX40673.1 metal-sulfur cluster assembly factor [Pedobacter steynii]SDM55522.1 Metal-sulfur cluster biosynthetic enzyme [Pedobacter steynii]
MNNPETLIEHRTQVVEALKTVIDPELQVNIVDLGLIYFMEMNEDFSAILIEMTLSSKSCPMGESILSATRNCMERSFKAFKVEVKLVWAPEWNADFISAAGIRKLRGY